MKRIFFIILLFLLIVQVGAWATMTGTPSSASYTITSFVFESASVAGSSSAYAMVGKMRDREIQIPYRDSALYKIWEGFFNTVFKATIVMRIDSVSPNVGTNDTSVRVTLSGAEFTGTTTVELTRAAESPIVGYDIVVVDDSTINCTFNLAGRTTGFWNVFVQRADGLADILVNGFEIRSPGLKVVGTPLNFPNPFNPKSGPTQIRYTLTQDAEITLYIFNILGERVATYKFAAGQVEGGHQGENIVLWSGGSPFGGMLPSGVYICQITSGGKVLGRVKIAIFK